jgi:hypothetical protein
MLGQGLLAFLVSVVIEGLGSVKCGVILAHLRNDYC